MKRVFTLIVWCVIAIGAIVVFPDRVSGQRWSWRAGEPVVHKNEPAAFRSQPRCPSPEIPGRIATITNEQQLCHFGGATPRFASVFIDGFETRLTVKFPHDSEYQLLEGVCQRVSGCLYAPDTDVLVERYQSAQLALGLRLYHQASKRVRHIFDPVDGRMEYVFDTERPDHVVSDTAGNPLSVGKSAFSRNGKWLAVEILDYGTALIEVETGKTRRIAAPGARYGWGLDPIEELAVSNSGDTVVVMGENTHAQLVTVIPGCGDIPTPDMTYDFPPDIVPCPQAPFHPAAYIQNFLYASQPAFDEEGGQLTFYVVSRGHGSKKISLRASGYTKPSIDYVALGDSFSSGEGESDDSFYFPGTNTPPDLCHTSRRSYPFLVAESLLIPMTRSVACSGARTTDIIGSLSEYMGQGGRLGWIASEQERRRQQAAAIDSFFPGHTLQSEFARWYEPAVVTVGIGGNDIGLMEKLKACVMPGTCEWAAVEHRKAVGEEIRALFEPLTLTYRGLAGRTPHGKVMAIGYPMAIDPAGGCDLLTGFLLDEDERIFMKETLLYLNQVIKAAAHTAGVVFLDIEESFKGKELCGADSQEAMNGIRGGDDLPLSPDLPMLKLIGNESFHPTPAGHRLIAQMIARKYGDIRHVVCGDVCRLPVWPIAVPDYWQQGPPSQARLVSVRIGSWDDVERIFRYELPPGSFAPGSTIRAELHSKSVLLGEMTADDQGGARGVLKIPNDVANGFHTVHFLGASYSFYPIDLYQLIVAGEVSLRREDGASPSHQQHGGNSEIVGTIFTGSADIRGAQTTSEVAVQKGGREREDKLEQSSVGYLFFGGGLLLGTLFLLIGWRWWRNSSEDHGG